MAGTLVIDTLKASTGVLATQNGMTGICKAWVNFNGNTAAIRGSFNVGSITKNGTGDYTVNFTTAMPNANYCITATASAVNPTGGSLDALKIYDQSYSTTGTNPTTTSCRMAMIGSAYVDCLNACVAIFA